MQAKFSASNRNMLTMSKMNVLCPSELEIMTRAWRAASFGTRTGGKSTRSTDGTLSRSMVKDITRSFQLREALQRKNLLQFGHCPKGGVGSNPNPDC